MLLFYLLCNAIAAQVNNITYRGQLLEEYSETPIPGATVLLQNESFLFESVTDAEGKFIFRKLPAGYYHLTFRSLGYQVKSVAEVEINTGIPRQQIFTLAPAEESLDEIVVKAQSRVRSAESVTSIYTLTVEESFRFPGTFYDPARLATHYAGVINENDQANNLVIRGNNPNGLAWYLEGVEIVNPNHLSNAGTFNDRSSQSGGGVNILSAQMLDNSTFLTGAFPAYYGNATSGIFDMQLREGANDQPHYTAQIGLIGIDAAIEGPVNKKKKDSYLINYRYSTLGLLSAIGVDLGDEAIQFQDLSFNLKWQVTQKNTLTFFGMGGVSKNVFNAPEFDLREMFKDDQNINFESRMGAIGIKLESAGWEHVLAYSGYKNARDVELFNELHQFEPFEHDKTVEQRMGIHSRRKFLFRKGAGQIGIRANILDYQISTAHFLSDEMVENSKNGVLIQSYAELNKSLFERIKISGGLHLTNFSLNKATAIEPRLGLHYYVSPKNEFAFSYGLHSRIAPPHALLISNRRGSDALKFIRSHHFVLAHNFRISNFSKLITEVYYQHLFNVPIATGINRSLSTINSIDYIASENLTNGGTASNAGIEMTYQQYFTKSTYFLFNGTVYDSKYTGADGVRRNTRYNGKHGFNLTAGKEFNWQKDHKIKTIGLNLRATYYGGFWEGPIDLAQSVYQYRTVFNESLAFTKQLPDFFKMDFRIYYKRIKTKYTSILGLDILNMTNQQNIAYHYFDLKKNEIATKYHLGLIPNLSYRIEF